MSEKKLRSIVEKKVPGLFLMILIFAIIEFGILMVCLLLSGNQNVLRVYNNTNTLVYEGIYDTNALNEFKTVTGIKNFKEEGYVAVRATIENGFPTRNWIALSISIPLVLVLFIVFIVRVFEDLFRSPKKTQSPMEKSLQISAFEETKFEKLFSTLGRLNIYALGATVVVVAFLYWMIPDLLIYLGKISFQTISELKWIILSIIILGSIYLIFREFLSFKTKNEIIRQQSEIQKNRDRLTIETQSKAKLLEDRPVDD